MEEKVPTRHVPVLLDEVIRQVAPRIGDTVVDVTFGGGSYSLALLKCVGESGRVIALDTDESAIERFRVQQQQPENLILRHANFAGLEAVLQEMKLESVDRIVADLGFSSDQIEDPARGFSLMHDGPLDMRLDQSGGITAQELLASASEESLKRMLGDYGDEPEARRIAKAIIKARSERALETTTQLKELVEKAYPRGKRSRMKIHPATRTFQALRIAVNGEDLRLAEFLKAAIRVLKPGGRLGIVTFHSGEDRAVKHFFREAADPCICPPDFPTCACGKKPLVRPITKKAVMPTESEVAKIPDQEALC